MKLVPLNLTLVVAGAALLLAGCSKKPTRPAPNETVVGTQQNTTPTGTDFGAPAGLEQRGDGFDAAGQNRAALQGQTVYFDFDKSDVRQAEREKLKAAKAYLDKNPTHRLLLEGHCDWRGTSEYNLSLGDRRANAVKKYLLSLGVPATRLETLSKGSLEAAKNSDDATMSKDRRVDLVVVNPSTGAAAPAPL